MKIQTTMWRFSLLIFATLSMSAAPALRAQTHPDSPASGLGFGGAMAAGDGAFYIGSAPVGWPRGDEPAGAVRIYKKDDGGRWMEVGHISAADGQLGDNFGRSMALDGGTLVVGAPGIGSAYVFVRDDAGAWRQAGKLLPDSLAPGAEFAGINGRTIRTRAVAITGDCVAVTAFAAGQRPGTGTGRVHVYRRDGAAWVQEAILVPDDAAEADGFGWAVTGAGDRFFVSAPGAGQAAGAVYVFARDDAGAWRQEARLQGSGLLPRSGLGMDVVAHGGRLYAGAPRHNRSGAVLVFERDATTESWQEVARLAPFRSAPRARGGAGEALAVADGVLLMAAGDGVYAYQLGGDGGWAAAHVIEPADDRQRRAFGRGLAITGDAIAIGSPMADYEEGIASVYERTSPLGPWYPSDVLAPEVDHLSSIRGERIDCEDGQAALFQCEKVDLLAFVSASELAAGRGVKMTDLWGWEDPDTGKEYVLQARTDGVAFVDISDPQHPVYVGQLMKTTTSPGSAWRDVKVYKNHAFIVADGAADHGMQVFDLTQLRIVDPAAMPVDFKETAHYAGIHSSHNIVINEETGFAYAVGNRAGGETCGGQLHMIDIRDPKNPTFAGCYTLPDAGGTHDAQCVIYRGPDADYAGHEVCLISNGSSFIIADVTEKSAPRTLAHVTYPRLAYTHQGWLSEDHRYFYMNDELDELNGYVDHTRTLVWDVQDLEGPILANEVMLSTKASDHNLYVKGHFLYQSNYQAGLRILNISDPLNPVEVAHFDTVPWGKDQPGFGGSWSNYPYFKSGVIAVSSRGEGLFLVRKRDVDI